MQIILDTHVFIWWNENPSKLTKKAREVIEDSANPIYISSVVIWEVVVKTMLGKLEAPEDPLVIALQQDFIPLPITGEHVLNLRTLEDHHADPFDRLLIAQTKHEGFTLLTRDKNLMKYRGFNYLES